MARTISVDDAKVMDVSRPGKGKIVPTSRPVVAPLVADTPKNDDTDAGTSTPETEQPAPLTPSSGHKVIEPLSETAVTEDTETADAIEAAAPEESAAEQDSEGAEPEPETAAGQDQTSEAAEVNALAKAAEAKKLAAKEAEAQKKKEEELQQLIDSKQYVVPIGQGARSARSRSGMFVGVLLAVLVLLLAAYLLVDAGVVDPGFDLPFELIK